VKLLVGVVAYGSAKDYVMPEFERMLEACMPECDYVWVTCEGQGHPCPQFGGDVLEIPPGLSFSEDILIPAHTAIRDYALAGDWDTLLWQNVDGLWQSRSDVLRVMSWLKLVSVTSPLICARTDSSYAVARRFVYVEGYTGEQVDIPESELASRKVIRVGFGGSDNMFFRRDAFDWGDGEHTPWYERVENGDPNLCFEEWILLELRKRGRLAMLDTGVKVWHVDEDGTARMWKGIEVPLRELTWDTQ